MVLEQDLCGEREEGWGIGEVLEGAESREQQLLHFLRQHGHGQEDKLRLLIIFLLLNKGMGEEKIRNMLTIGGMEVEESLRVIYSMKRFHVSLVKESFNFSSLNHFKSGLHSHSYGHSHSHSRSYSRDNLATPRDHLTTPRDHLTTPRDHLATPRDHLAIPRDHLTTPRDHLTTPRDRLATPRDYLATPREHLTTPRDHLASPRDHLATPRDASRRISRTAPISPVEGRRWSQESLEHETRGTLDILKTVARTLTGHRHREGFHHRWPQLTHSFCPLLKPS